jgi:hypothetical protein
MATGNPAYALESIGNVPCGLLLMIDPTESLYKNITLNDVQLASAYYPILIDLAKHKHSLTYNELVAKAKELYPANQVVQRAIAVSTGRKLDVVRIFTSQRDLPDLTCLVINKGSGECGTGFTQHFDPVASRNKVFSFDWSTISTDFDGYIKHTETVVTPRKRRKEADALKIMANYYNQNKDRLPSSVREKREVIIELLMEGFSEVEAFSQAISG